MKVVQIGQLPPPIGGISRHIESLHLRLQQDNHVSQVISFSRKRMFSPSFWRTILTSDAVINHEIGFWGKCFPALLSKFSKGVLVLSIHGDGLKDQLTTNSVVKLSATGKFLLKHFIHYYKHFFVSNLDIKDFLISLKIPNTSISTIPEFIPIEQSGDFSIERADMTNFINSRNFFVATGDLRDYLEVPLYGFDMIVDFCRNHINQLNNHCFILNLINNNSEQEVSDFKKSISDSDLDNLIFVNSRPLLNIQDLIKKSSGLIRPTNTDGNSVSVMEALWLNVPVLASDTCPRPNGCILFANRNQEDFNNKLLALISSPNSLPDNTEQFNSYETIIRTLSELNL